MTKPDRPVSGFVPIGDVVAGVELPDCPALTPAAPQARHHFTTLRQVDQLIEASEADADLGFMARLLALCSLPRTNPKNRLQYVRCNGPYTLTMTASSAGVKLPFGTLPRLLLAWVCSEAVRTQRRDLVLGRSLYEFMHKLGLDDQGGGERGNRVRLKNQMERLFSCSVSLVYADAGHKVQVHSFIADRAEYWWDVSRPNAPVLWNSTIELGEKFFQEIIAHPIPIDMNTLRALKRSSLGLDWFCCKVWDHARESVGWTSLRGQSEHLVDQLRLPDHVALRHPSRLSLAERMHDLDAAQGPPRRGESLEAQHRPGAAFDESVVLLDDVVQILALAKIRTRSDESLVSDGFERDRVGGVLVHGHHARGRRMSRA